MFHPLNGLRDLRNRAANHLGRRGFVLVLFSLIFAAYGLHGMFDPTPDGGRFMFYSLLSPELRGVLWIVPSVIAIVAALHKTKNDSMGFAVIQIPGTILAVSYAFSYIGHLFGLTDWTGGWIQAVTWTLIVTLLAVISGWTEISNQPAEQSDTPLPELRKQTVLVLDEDPEKGAAE